MRSIVLEPWQQWVAIATKGEIKLAVEMQPLEAPKLMSKLEPLLRLNLISDPKQLAPLIRTLSTDERLPLIARNHAGRLLKKIEK